MRLGIVIGSIWATRKEEGMTGLKLLVIQPIKPDGSFIQTPIIAADRIGAGKGDQIIFAEGSSARAIVPDVVSPLDAAIIGIVDQTEI
ncbi:EutN/CcmL family microcompartment protein [Paenibacillus sp. BSR1-1]|uniref:EutN/CcmL family microcompartment protein n=1 Tax=Paenibacillus sp. BSR1-1 TaxID=3020845 RepID=UPI0025AFDA47|nr:EutN/CcmL family microcompartment protein [Paenibacillus sp. BSR1-1]MDN3015850.1 EutN/CcmL family microcompartment protein [Paenibacillus sp. BSR1-1]